MNNELSIKGIVLTKQGEDIVVEVWMPDGSYCEVIRERAEGPISHCVHANGIYSRYIKQPFVTVK